MPGMQGPSSGPGTAWTPPPKPGLVPLRPLGFGTLLGSSFQVLRRNPKASFGSALLIQALVVLVTILVVGVVTFFAVSRMTSATPEEEGAVVAGGIAAIILSGLVAVVLSFAATALLQGIIVLEVARGTLGEKLTLGALWRRAWRRLGPLILWTLLYATAVVVAVGVVGVAVALLILQGDALIAVGIILGVLGSLGLVVLFFWLFTKLSLVPSIIVLERARVFTAMRRSWRLTNGYFWRTLGVQLLVSVIMQVATQIVATPITLIFGVGSSLLFPTEVAEPEAADLGPYLALNGVLLLVTVVFGAIAAVAQSACAALVYIDLRMRKEGLDLALVRFVEHRAARGAAADLDDPYGSTAQAAAENPSGSPWA